jgi:uroporphyrinogen-III decarboxylase
VRYRAERAGAQAIGIGRGQLLRVRDASQMQLPYDTHVFASCPALEAAHLLSFAQDGQYWFEVATEPGVEIALFVEYLDAFVQSGRD